MKVWAPVDVIAVIFTVSIAICIGAAVLYPIFSGNELSEGKAKLVGTIVAAVISIVSMYVGAAIQKRKP